MINADMKNFTKDKILKEIYGGEWLFTNHGKTKSSVKISH
ncbi:Hypothetical protein I595_3207 [Croceitalea dokdonensis DOKDO 023]|uniref:Uncharacterized protein n=1 Tax=Croceitalea dokdonensis DOKDO 023 TaxID=1300341 RepID=A0A0P7ANR2_9FLAO|nr:Hypothetical protein I595_3207 [Croceitalea dokdonensis DOKDO 023]